MPKPPTPKTPNELARRADQQRAIRAELAALAVRAREAGLPDIARWSLTWPWRWTLARVGLPA